MYSFSSHSPVAQGKANKIATAVNNNNNKDRGSVVITDAVSISHNASAPRNSIDVNNSTSSSNRIGKGAVKSSNSNNNIAQLSKAHAPTSPVRSHLRQVFSSSSIARRNRQANP